MAFGQELKDFVSGFKTGYGISDQSERTKQRREALDVQKAARGPSDDYIAKFKQRRASTAIPTVNPQEDRTATGFYQDGGYVREEDESNNAFWERERARTQQAPSQEPAPSQASEDFRGAFMRSVQENAGGGGFFSALDDGMKGLISEYGLGQGRSQALPSGGSGRSEAFARAGGAPDPRLVREVSRVVNPNGEMDDAQEAMYRLAATHQYFLERGEPEKARRAAAALVDYTRMTAGRLASLGVAAGERGDVAGMTKAVVKAANTLPTGERWEAHPTAKGVAYRKTDLTTGEATEGVVSAQEMLRMAMGFAQGQGAMEYLMASSASGRARSPNSSRAAGGRRGAVPAPTGVGDESALEREYFGVKRALDALPEDAPEDQRRALEEAARDRYNALLQSTTRRIGRNRSATNDLKLRGIEAPASVEISPEARERREANTEIARSGALRQALEGTTQPQQTTLPTEVAGEGDPVTEGGQLPVPPSFRQALAIDPDLQGDINTEFAAAPGRRITNAAARHGEEQARERRDRVVADQAYRKAKGRKEFSEPFNERVAPFEEAMFGAADDKGVRSGGIAAGTQLSQLEKRQLTDVLDRVAAKNDINPDTLTRAVFDMATQITGPAPRILPNGLVEFGGQRLAMDDLSLAQLASMRASHRRRYQEALGAKADKEQKGAPRRQGGASPSPQARSVRERSIEQNRNRPRTYGVRPYE